MGLGNKWNDEMAQTVVKWLIIAVVAAIPFATLALYLTRG